MIGCDCKVCRSEDFHDKRLRTSAYIQYEGLKLVIDAGPDFRQQILRAGITSLDAILLTHQHKDHTGGLDDVRAYNYFQRKAFPIYCEPRVEESLKNEYSYAFAAHKYPGVPEFEIHHIDEHPFKIQDREIVPIRVLHYKLPILGFRFGKLGYITDGSQITEEELQKLRGVEVFVINTVRRAPHISHFSLGQAVEICKTVGARQSYLTHLSHQLECYQELKRALPEGIAPAYDGLKVDF